MTDTATVPYTVPQTVEQEERSVAAHAPRRGDFAPMNIAQAMEFANVVKTADGMIPKAYLGNPGKILACVLAGQELGIGPMASLRAFHVVEGKPCADYTFWIARLRAAGYRVEWTERTQERVTLQLTAPNGATHTETWDKARAITAGLWNGKDNWKKYPQAMLSARCVTSAGRVFAGEVMFGCYENDEAEEIREVEAKVVTGPAGTATERVATAAGTAVQKEALDAEAKARECTDMIRALKLTPAQVADLMKSIGVEPGRLSTMPLESLQKLAERLDQEAAGRGDGGPTNLPPGTRVAAGSAPAEREPGSDDA
jgi:hypothetical protein